MFYIAIKEKGKACLFAYNVCLSYHYARYIIFSSIITSPASSRIVLKYKGIDRNNKKNIGASFRKKNKSLK